MKNKIAILSTAYLPPIQYVTKFLLYDEIIIDPTENYQKQSYRNRCNVFGANGILSLSIPLNHDNPEHTPVKSMTISNNHDWQKIHWRSLESAYRCSPFFEYYEDELKDFYFQKHDSLMLFNMELLHTILGLLKIKTSISEALDYKYDYSDIADDFRNVIHPKIKKIKPDPYFNSQRYIQVFESKFGFLENLSIVDLLFCQGPNSIEILRASCNLNQ
ncbi:MAG: WbqC family protein [Bacteroidota bacterium]